MTTEDAVDVARVECPGKEGVQNNEQRAVYWRRGAHQEGAQVNHVRSEGVDLGTGTQLWVTAARLLVFDKRWTVCHSPVLGYAVGIVQVGSWIPERWKNPEATFVTVRTSLEVPGLLHGVLVSL